MSVNVPAEVISNFLKYTFPADMSPDGGLSFSKGPHPVTGANLLTAQQAREMFENVLTYVPKEAAKPVTEADEAIVDEWYTRDVQSLDMFMQQLDKDYEHDYGTICHAVAAMAVQAAKLMDKQSQGGITGFQAAAVMWQFISKYMNIRGPMRLVKFEDMLYPQHAEKFEKTIGKDTWQFLQTKAMENLINSPDAHPDVVAHWKSVVDGVVPFSYTVQGE